MPAEPLPRPGLGTMRFDSDEECVETVSTALELGYRHVDTAQKYETETQVGEAIDASSVARDEVFLATKIEENNLASDDVLSTAEESLERLGVEYVDLLYVHWPWPTYDAEETLGAFDELVESGLTRHVGVANFTPELLDEARDALDAPLFAHQVEMHPMLPQADLHAYALEHDLHLVAYCPVMRGQIFDVPELQAIADDAGLSVVQLSLAWLCSKENVVPIPKATGEAHLRENFEAASIELDGEIVDRIETIDREQRVVDPPEKGPWNW